MPWVVADAPILVYSSRMVSGLLLRGRPGPRTVAIVLAVAATALASACPSPLTPARVPMPVVELAPGTPGNPCLVLCLPGRWNRPRSFAEHDFAALARAAGVDATIVAADAHIGYYARRTVLERLHLDVVEPERARGRDRLWLVGTSMGGVGSLLYAGAHPGEVAGIVLIAPYLGEREILDRVRAAGGLKSWQPPETPPPGQDFQLDIWRVLKVILEADSGGPSLFLAHGGEDDLADGHRLLAEALPPGRVFTVAGGHDWKTWSALWERVLATGEIARACR